MRVHLETQASFTMLHTHTHTDMYTTGSISLHTAKDQRQLWSDRVAENKYKVSERLMNILNEDIPVKI